MNEIELLRKLVALEKEQNILEIKIDVSSSTLELLEFKKELCEINTEIVNIEKNLIEVKDKKYSQKAKNLTYDQLQEYITEINKAKDGQKLSRHQGYGLENHLFSKILSDLNCYIKDEVTSVRSLAYLQYSYSDYKTIEIAPLSEFLKKELYNLTQIENINFIKLRNFFEAFKIRLIKAFIE